MMNAIQYVVPLILLMLTGCEFVTKKEFKTHSSRISSLEAKARSLGSQTSSNSRSIKSARSDTKKLEKRLSQRDSELVNKISKVTQMSKNEDQRLRSKISGETVARKRSMEGLNDSIGEAFAGEARLRKIIGNLLQAEKELFVSLVEIKQVIEDLKKRGTLTTKDIQASKAVKLEAAAWAKRIDSIRAQLDALGRSRKTKKAD